MCRGELTYIVSIIFYLPDRIKKDLATARRLVAVARERVPGATNGGNLSPTALRVLLAARPFFHPSTYLLRARTRQRSNFSTRETRVPRILMQGDILLY